MNGYAASRVEGERGRAAQNAFCDAALVVLITGLSSLTSWRCLNAAQLEQYYSGVHLVGKGDNSANPLGTATTDGPCHTGPIDTFSLDSLFARAEPIAVSTPLMLGILAAAAVLSLPRATWQWFGLFTTLVHELGHAVAAILTGRVVHGIRIRRNHSGDALSSGRGALGTVVSGMMGYPAPAVVGAALLWCVFNGYTAIALFAGAVVLVLTLLVVRNLFGVLVVLASAGASAALWFYATADVQGYALLVLGVALLVGAVRGLFAVIAVHTSNRSQLQTSDAYLLFRRTGIPSPLWLALFAVIIGACVFFAVTAYVLPRVA